jgi:hypothetical protein
MLQAAGLHGFSRDVDVLDGVDGDFAAGSNRIKELKHKVSVKRSLYINIGDLGMKLVLCDDLVNTLPR